MQAAMSVHGAARYFQAAVVEFVAQLIRIGGQIAVRTELDPFVTDARDLIQKAAPWRLQRIVGKPHAPGVRAAPEQQSRRVRSDSHLQVLCWLYKEVRRPHSVDLDDARLA